MGCVCGCTRPLSLALVPRRVMSTEKSATAAPTEYEVPESVRARRPTSPHLTIYKLPLPAITSITHRVTGGILGGGMAHSRAY